MQKVIIGFIILLMIALFVKAGDVIVESGKIDVDSKLFINDQGNVGIGTVNPTSKLYVAGDMIVDAGMRILSGNFNVAGSINATDSSGAGISTDNTGNVIIQLG